MYSQLLTNFTASVLVISLKIKGKLQCANYIKVNVQCAK